MKGTEVGGNLEELSVTESKVRQCERAKWVGAGSCGRGQGIL